MVVFLIVIAVEALVIVALVVAFFTSGQSLPGINFQSYVRPRCMNLSVLQLGPNSTGINGNRTVEFGCLIWDSRYNVFQRSTALSRVSGLADWSIGGGPHPMSAVPTFKVPTGYLELYLGGYGCGQHDVGIVSGAPAVFTDYHWQYYYCAVISNAVGSTQPFTVHWSQFKDLSFVPPSINGEQARAMGTCTCTSSLLPSSDAPGMVAGIQDSHIRRSESTLTKLQLAGMHRANTPLEAGSIHRFS